MDCDGTRPTVLARRAGMTPQAMSELVGHLERRGYVRRIPDPDDRRGRVVVYAERGVHAAETGEAFFADLETRWRAVIGLDRLQEITAALMAVIEGAAELPEPLKESRLSEEERNSIPDHRKRGRPRPRQRPGART